MMMTLLLCLIRRMGSRPYFLALGIGIILDASSLMITTKFKLKCTLNNRCMKDINLSMIKEPMVKLY